MNPLNTPAPKVWKVLCVDDHRDILLTLKLLIDSQPDMECAGCLSSADTLLEETRRLSPDVVLIDLSMPGKSPLHALAELKCQFPQSTPIVFSALGDASEHVQRATEAGAKGWVDKCAEAETLLMAVRKVAAGGEFFHH